MIFFIVYLIPLIICYYRICYECSHSVSTEYQFNFHNCMNNVISNVRVLLLIVIITFMFQFWFELNISYEVNFDTGIVIQFVNLVYDVYIAIGVKIYNFL